MIPNATLLKVINGEIDYSSDDIRVGLLDDSQAYVADPDTHEFVEDVLADANEYSDVGYDRVELDNQTTTQDDANNRAVWDANDATFPDLGSSDGDTIQAAFIFKQVTDETDSPVLRVVEEDDVEDFPLATNGQDVTIQWDSEDGIKTQAVE